ncbi:uncharacterized protein LOC121267244 [Juglans microcarpa x Juglans regia]|uniref:uncharacterized protein LOC121267244 n=1 Tax=Juglans microcarpa x Juglans regia TaxID=2249226 RepID=UPI001B7E7F2B|nr:uncharacterized protein LOC121267244 [Juglans microcarpa x Juglans regia]
MFTTWSAWNCKRIKGQTFPWAKWVWNPAVPRKISMTMWKAMHECLPLDDRVRRIGILVVSSCDCCLVWVGEDVDHIFAKGGYTAEMWRRCSLVLGIPRLEGKPWKERVACWHRKASDSLFSGQLLGLLPSILIWRLWGRLCKARMEGVAEPAQSVWCSIRLWISWAALKIKEVKGLTQRDEDVLRCFKLPCPSTQEKVATTAKRNPLKEGWVKLNIDGCSLGNPGDAGARGIIRNSTGEFISGFAVTAITRIILQK